MKIVTETPRLILREFELFDAESMFKLNNDKEVLKYTGDVPFKSVQDAYLFLENYTEYDKNGFGRWAVIKKENNEFIGWCGLKLNEEKLIDIGFRFFKKDWKNGFATEAAKACIDYGFNKLGLTHIIGRADSQNKVSIRVLEKLGMEYWKQQQVEGLHNAVYYRINNIS